MLKYIFVFLFLSLNLQAQEESLYSETARLRQYSSGADEGDLVVQKNLNQAQSKKKKQNKNEPSEGF